jgi:uncharacterized protein (DUF1778 family)
MPSTRKPVAVRLSDAERAAMTRAAQASAETLTGWMRRILVAAAKRASGPNVPAPTTHRREN